MIEAALMAGLLPGPWSNWEVVGSTNLLATGSAIAQAEFPKGTQTGDLVVAIQSSMNESVKTTMVSEGWQHWASSMQDYVCTARFAAGLAPPVYSRAGNNSIFVAVLVFRSQGWSSVRLRAHTSPATEIEVATELQNELLLVVGLTPKTTRSWRVSMSGAVPSMEVDRKLAPALHVSFASIDFPKAVTGVYVDALSGSERNLILSAS